MRDCARLPLTNSILQVELIIIIIAMVTYSFLIESFIRLWRNECLRVFHDRLISDHDREIVKYNPSFLFSVNLFNCIIVGA